MIKGILFDLDNTLIDFMTMKKRCTEAAVTAMIDAGLEMSRKKAYRLMLEEYKKYGIEDQTIFQKFLQKHLKQVDYKILAAAIIAYRKVKSGQLVPYPHVRSTLLDLKKNGLKLGIVSDAPKMQAWLRLTSMNLVDYFDVVLGYEDTGKLKPCVEPFRKALRKMKLKPDEVLFIGDNPHRDIIGARKVGMKTVLAVYGQTFKGGNADYKIKDIRELMGIMSIM